MSKNNDRLIHWTSIIAKCLAMICLDKLDLRKKNIGEQAPFLKSLGFDREDIAAMLNSTEGSITKLLQYAKKNKSKKKGRAKK